MFLIINPPHDDFLQFERKSSCNLKLETYHCLQNICLTALRGLKVVLQLSSEQVNIPTMHEKAQNMSVHDVELSLQWTKIL